MATPEMLLKEVSENMAKLAEFMAKLQGGGGGTGGGGGKRVLEMKNISTTKFSGKPEDWPDWSFVFRRSIKASSIGAYNMMEKVEKADPKDGAVDDISDLDLQEERYSAELYDILCQVCDGDAMSILKNVEDCSGARAWQRLWRKYNPRTMARRIMMLTEVTCPPRITELKDVEQAINSWNEKYTKLCNEFGEKLSDPMRIAIILNIMPRSIQEHVYSHIGTEESYDNTVYKIKLMAGQKMAMDVGGPVPMDVGGIHKEREKERLKKLIEEVESERDEGGEEVAAVSMNTKCHRCGGYGHLARHCGTPKGGEKGGGKGDWGKAGKADFGKGGWKGQVGGQAGAVKGGGKGGVESQQQWGGKGYQGACYNCGKIGHKRWECRAPVRTNAVEEEEIEEQEMGGVWMIGQVEEQAIEKDECGVCGEESEEEVYHGTCCRQGARRLALEVHNKFESLTEEDEEEVEELPELCCGDGGIGTGCPCANVPPPPFHYRPPVRQRRRAMENKRERKMQVQRIFQVEMAEKLTRESAIKFNEAKVRRPLASAVQVAKAGNRVVLEEDGGYIENIKTKERMKVKVEKNTYVFDIQVEDGEKITVTLDSGAGCSVWPRGWNPGKDSKLLPRDQSVRMVAANGTDIPCYGQRVVKFRGIQESDFPGQM